MINFQMMIHTFGKLPNETIRDYISIRYERWLDYARYKCSKSSMEGEENDVLDEVLLNVLQKDEQLLMKLYRTKKVQKGKKYTELDFFILRALDINITSETSPYRYKNRCIPRANVELNRLKIVDETDPEVDKAEVLLKEYRLVVYIYRGLDLTSFERAVFDHRFINNESFTQWQGPEEYRKVFATYHHVIGIIHQILYFYNLTRIKPKSELTNRQSEIANQFVKSHKILIKQK